MTTVAERGRPLGSWSGQLLTVRGFSGLVSPFRAFQNVVDSPGCCTLTNNVFWSSVMTKPVISQPRGPVRNRLMTPVASQDMKTIGAVISDGPRKLAGFRFDEAWRLAEDLVFDAMVTALLQGALAAPPEKRDQLLTGLGVRAVRDNPKEPPGRGDTEFSGMAALQEAELLDPSGHFKVPELGTAEYNRYKKWYSGDAKGLAGQVDALVEPTEDKMAECLPPR